MKKKEKQKTIIFSTQKDAEELGNHFIRLGEALKNGNTLVRDLVNLSLSCGLMLRISMTPKANERK